MDKASNAFQRQQQQIRDKARDDKDYEGTIERAKEKTFAEVNKKHEDFSERADQIAVQAKELVQKLPPLPSDVRAKRLKLEGSSLFNKLADLKKQIDDLNESVAKYISLSARIVSSKALTIVQQLLLLLVFAGVGYVVYQNVHFPNPYIIPSIVGGAWFAFALWLFIARLIKQRRRVKRLVDDARFAAGALECVDDLREQARREYDPDAAIEESVDRLLKKHERERERSERKQAEAKKEIAALKTQFEKEQSERRVQSDKEIAEVEQAVQAELAEAAAQLASEEQAAKDALAAEQRSASQETFDQREHCLAERDRILTEIQTYAQEKQRELRAQYIPWAQSEHWRTWIPGDEVQQHIPLATMSVDLGQSLSEAFLKDAAVVKAIDVPVDLMLPQQSLMLCQMRAEHGMPIIHQAMFRLLSNMPIGQARFTLIDPRALGEHFSQFLRLVDFDEHIVGPKVWTAQNEIEQVLKQMTEHAEKVIQKFLRHQYQTLDEYNKAAGDLAEPYQILVIAEFPHGFSTLAIERLSALMEYGSRCGIFIWIQNGPHEKMPKGLSARNLQELGAYILETDDDNHIRMQDDTLEAYPLSLEQLPEASITERMLDVIGEGTSNAANRALPMRIGAPEGADQWSSDSGDILRIPIGRSGAERLQYLELGVGTAQHVLIGGRTGSGKSTLLHIIVTCGALWHAPDQLEFYLVDFKKGVEFKTYASNAFPHARVIAVESDREYALSVLQTIDAELERRGALFRKAEVQDLASYRAARPDEFMPRSVLVIDEFHEFFTEDDAIARDAALLLERFVRQGRAFGVHIILGSQSIAGSMSLARSAIGQIGVRIALQCNESDSQLILSEENAAARLLERPGEAIYNGRSGQVDGNDPFQVFWLTEEEQTGFLKSIRGQAPKGLPQTWVFEGNIPAEIPNNAELMELIDRDYQADDAQTSIWLGEPNAIRGPVSLDLAKRPGQNVLCIGHHREAVYGMLQSSLLCLAARYPAQQIRLVIVDADDPDPRLRERLYSFAQSLPHAVECLDAQSGVEVIAELGAAVEDGKTYDGPPCLIFILGFGRMRALRQVEDFSFGASDAEKTPDKRFADLLENGPEQGIHNFIWCESANVCSTAFQRSTMRQFELRLLFQMSSGDSSDLIDDGSASRLGLHHALLCNLETLQRDKFRPYVLMETDRSESISQRLQQRSIST